MAFCKRIFFLLFFPQVVELFLVAPSYYTKDIGSSVEIRCMLAPGEPFQGFVRKNGLSMNMDNFMKYRLLSSYGKSLIIYNIQLEDAGEYYCDSKQYGRVRSIIRINPSFPSEGEVEDLIIFHGTKAVIEVKFIASDVPSIFWSRESQRLLTYDHDTGKVTHDSGEDEIWDFDKSTGNLIVKNVKFENGGMYTIHIKRDGNQWRSKAVRVIVEAKSCVIREKSRVIEPIDYASYQVRCVAFGLPVPVIEFYNEKEQLMKDVQFTSHEDQHEREAIVTSSIPSQYVRCLAKNKHADDSFKIFIPPDVSFSSTSEKQRLMELERGTIKINLKLSGELPNIKWEVFNDVESKFQEILVYSKKDKSFNFGNGLTSRYDFDKNSGHLIINRVSKEDARLYKVSIEDWIEWKSKVVEIEVDVPATIVESETRIILPVGHKSFRFQCTAVGNPSPSVSFVDETGNEVLEGIKETSKEGKKVFVLESHIQTRQIKCMVKNNHSEDSLEVTIPPSVSFGKVPDSLSFQPGENIRIKVDIKAAILPDIKWEKYSKTEKKYLNILYYNASSAKVSYNEGSKETIEFEQENGDLRIIDISSEDAGTYKVNLNGNFGWISKIIEVKVIVENQEKNWHSAARNAERKNFVVSKLFLGSVGGAALLLLTMTWYFTCFKHKCMERCSKKTNKESNSKHVRRRYSEFGRKYSDVGEKYSADTEDDILEIEREKVSDFEYEEKEDMSEMNDVIAYDDQMNDVIAHDDHDFTQTESLEDMQPNIPSDSSITELNPDHMHNVIERHEHSGKKKRVRKLRSKKHQ